MSSLSSFARSLRSLQSGQISQDELLAEIYRHLAAEKASPVALLKVLKAQQLAQPLRSDVHESILGCILDWPQDPTVITSSPEAQRGDRRAVVGVGDVLNGRFDLIELIGELSLRDPDFRSWWADHDIQRRTYGTKHFHHPLVGDLYDALDDALRLHINKIYRERALASYLRATPLFRHLSNKDCLHNRWLPMALQ